MKNFTHGIICLLLMFSCTGSAAQNPTVKEPDKNRPSLFEQLPQRMNCRIDNLVSLFEFSVGSQVNIHVSDSMQFQGVVSSVATKSENTVKSIVVRSGNFPGAALTFSKFTKDDGSIFFAGRIISFQHADAYEITFEKGQYSFVKKYFYDLVND
jgi:hypothetical protein